MSMSTCGGQRSDLNSLFATLTCQKPDFDTTSYSDLGNDNAMTGFVWFLALRNSHVCKQG